MGLTLAFYSWLHGLACSVVTIDVLCLTPHHERHTDRYAVLPGALSWLLRGLTWSVILLVTRSHLERHPVRYVVSPGASS